MRKNPNLKSALSNSSTWLIVGMLVVIGFFHYFRGDLLPSPANAFLSRHAVDRILFLLPVIVATHAFGRAWGLLTLAVVLGLMLPRIIWISQNPADTLIETLAAAFVGYYLIRLIHSQAQERALRQAADERQIQTQRRLNAVSEQISAELELDRILIKVIHIAEELIAANCGGIALFDLQNPKLHYAYLHNLPQALTSVEFSESEGVLTEVLRTGQPQIVGNYLNFTAANPDFLKAGVISIVAVPILRGEKVFGVLSLMSTETADQFSESDADILKGIGRQAGIAIENARLYDQMRFYARQITRAQEDERKRIARELHDDTIQMLIALSRRIEGLTIAPSEVPAAFLKRVEVLQQIVNTSLRSLRRFIQDLRPPALDHLGLVAALEGLTTSMTADQIQTELNVIGQPLRMLPERELILFRIVQEALNNIRRHSSASQAMVQVEFLRDQIKIQIKDNGQGFKAARIDDLVATGKLGLAGMHERCNMLAGTLIIQSGLDVGTTVDVTVPIR